MDMAPAATRNVLMVVIAMPARIAGRMLFPCLKLADRFRYGLGMLRRSNRRHDKRQAHQRRNQHFEDRVERSDKHAGFSVALAERV